MPLYITDEGQPISTQSMLSAFGRCPRLAMYKYHDRLKPRVMGAPLKRGQWMHALLEAKYNGKKWKKEHKKWSMQFGELFDEEREKLGDLPRECDRLMRSYLWHYRDDADWRVLEVEMTLETEFPDGSLFRGRVDLLVETEFGLYIVDHKNMRTIPTTGHRIRDVQSVLYVWAARELGIPVQGFIWNYLRTDPPRPIKFTKKGLPYKRQGDTDYLTAKASIVEAGFDLKGFKDRLNMLKAQRYQHGAPQTSPFFRREILEKDDGLINRVLKERTRTSKRAHKYKFNDRDAVERVTDRSCDWCSYRDICNTELLGGDTRLILKHQFKVGDPMDYYHDQKERND